MNREKRELLRVKANRKEFQKALSQYIWQKFLHDLYYSILFKNSFKIPLNESKKEHSVNLNKCNTFSSFLIPSQLQQNESFKYRMNVKKNMGIKKTLLGILAGTFILWNSANAVDFRGHIKPSHDGVLGANTDIKAYVIRNPPGSDDTVSCITDPNGKYVEFSENLETVRPLPSDSIIYILAKKDDMGNHYETRTKWKLLSGGNYIYEICLDDSSKLGTAYTTNVKNFSDTLASTRPLTAYAISWIAKNPFQKDTSVVDTLSTGSSAHPHYYDYWFNSEKQDSILVDGDTIFTHFYKTRNDTTWFADTFSIVGQNTFDNAILTANQVYFPQSFSIFKDIGIEDILVPDSADSGQVIMPGVVTRNLGTINQNPTLHCKINEFYEDSMNVVAQPGIDTFYFSPCTLNSIGEWTVTDYSSLQGDVNPANDSLQKIIVVNPIGIKEENIEQKVKKDFEVYPSHGNIFNTNYRGKVSVYDVSGRKVGVSMIQDGKLNLAYLSKGVYFIKPKDETLPIKKVVKTKN